jgi:hypothetical protein
VAGVRGNQHPFSSRRQFHTSDSRWNPITSTALTGSEDCCTHSQSRVGIFVGSNAWEEELDITPFLLLMARSVDCEHSFQNLFLTHSYRATGRRTTSERFRPTHQEAAGTEPELLGRERLNENDDDRTGTYCEFAKKKACSHTHERRMDT